MNKDSKYFKLSSPCRDQYQYVYFCLDNLLPAEHKARDIWSFVQEMNTDVCLNYINSFAGGVGRPSVNPKILLSLWLYTILDGNNSARKLEELCLNHNVYKWICGGVSVNRTILAEFRSHNSRKFDELLTSCLAVMIKSGVIEDEDFSQDGTKVKANAGFNSFKTEKSLKNIEEELNQCIKQLKLDTKAEPDINEKRKKNAQECAKKEKRKRVADALKNLESNRIEKKVNGKRNNNIVTEKDLKNVRASITDPEVRKMKMGDGGFRLAYNVQFATGLDSRVIFGVNVVQTSDPGTAIPLMTQVKYRLEKLNLKPICKWIADSAYSAARDIDFVALLFPNVFYYAPPKNKNAKIEKKTDSEAVKTWRKMIDTDEVKELYKKRCSTAEFSNMHVKNQSLTNFSVRGLIKAKGVALLHAIAQNLSRYWNLIKKKAKKILV